MNDGRTSDNGNPAAMPADLKNLAGNLCDKCLTGSFRRHCAVHELEGTALAGAFRIADTYSLFPDNNKISFVYFSQGHSRGTFPDRVDNDKKIHLNRGNRYPFTTVFHLGRVIAGRIESFGNNV